MVLTVNPLLRRYGLYINGRECEPGAGFYEKINPADEMVLGVAPNASVANVHQAIQAARAAFDDGPWPRLSGKARARYLTKIADLLKARRDDLIDLAIAETGCRRLVAEAVHVDPSWQALYTWADYAARPLVEGLPPVPFGVVDPASPLAPAVNNRAVCYEPVGVVGAITAFNVPLFLNIAKLGPALAAGNTIVLKPSPLTPFSALAIPKLIEEADLPPGVLNVITGLDPELGQTLTDNPLVDMITFTGSAAVGRTIMGSAARTLKKLLLELGGKSALIVLGDADPAQAVQRGLGTLCTNAGQGCSVTSRVLVPRALYPSVAAGMVQAAAGLKVGDPRDPQTMIAPLISATQRERVEGYIQRGVAEGATLAFGGRRPAHLPRGFYLEPAIFTDVRNEMAIAREEIFGPVQCVIPYDGDDDEAIRLANDSPYGLYGLVLTNDLGRGVRVAQQVRTGAISVNRGVAHAPDAPFGGYKQSGLGREWGIQGLREYQETKTIAWA